MIIINKRLVLFPTKLHYIFVIFGQRTSLYIQTDCKLTCKELVIPFTSVTVNLIRKTLTKDRTMNINLYKKVDVV